MKRGLQIISALALIVVGSASAIAGGQSRPLLAAPHARTATSNPTPVTSAIPFNNEGISYDNNPAAANFDGGGASYSATALTTAGFAPGASITSHGYTFQWVTPVAGQADNWQAAGQEMPLTTSAASLAFVGAAIDGPTTGSGLIRYTDGSTSAYTLTFSDWTLNGGGGSLDPSNTILVTTPYRNTPTGQENVATNIFMATIALTAGKTVTSVDLPDEVNQGALHVFAIGAIPGAANYTRKGISNDSNTSQGNFDGGHRSYSNNALDAAGLSSGMIMPVYGFDARWPVVAAGVKDTWQVPGTVIPLQGSGATLEILGAAVGGAASGVATLTYTDGTIQPFTLAFSDWTLGGGSKQVLGGDYVIARMPYRNTPTGPQYVSTYLFATYVGLWPGKTLQSLTLPTSETGGQLVVVAAAPGANSVPFNVAAISANSAPSSANLDGGVRSYSNNALAAAGLPSGALVTVQGDVFQWPINAAAGPDAWQTAGQTIPLVGSGQNTLGLLGAATDVSTANGAVTGVITITFTDGTTQQSSIAFSDWTLDGGAKAPVAGDIVAAKTPYRNTSAGPEQVATYVFFTSVTIAPANVSKTIQSVALPSAISGGNMNIFAVSLQSAPTTTPPPTGWNTYLGSLARTDYNGAETTLTAANASQLSLKWTAHGAQGISVQPIISNGMMYWGSWDGLMHATNASGADIWTTNLGQTSIADCDPPTVGVGSTPTLGMIGSTPVMFVAGGNRTVYALNLSNGAIVWATTLQVSTNYFVWDSPAVFNGSVYIGISSFGDCPRANGKLFKLNVATGAIQATTVLSPDSCPGDGIWGSPTIDSATGVIYVATGNGCETDLNSSAVEAYSSGDLSLVDRWQIPASETGDDSDFGNTPTLFTATINGVTRQMVGVADKNGYYYALDRTNLSAGPLWSDVIATGGDCPDCGDGSISPSAWDGATLYVAGGNTTIGGAACTGSVRAVNPATGAYLWEHCFTTGTVLGAVAAIPGLVVAGAGTATYALNAATGATVFQYTDTSSGSYFFSAATIFGGMVYAPNDDGNLYAFGL